MHVGRFRATDASARLEVFVEDFRRSSYAAGDDGEPLAIAPNPIDEEMVHDHENLLGATLPPLFRAYLLSWCLPSTDLYVGQLPPSLPTQPFDWVERWSGRDKGSGANVARIFLTQIVVGG